MSGVRRSDLNLRNCTQAARYSRKEPHAISLPEADVAHLDFACEDNPAAMWRGFFQARRRALDQGRFDFYERAFWADAALQARLEAAGSVTRVEIEPGQFLSIRHDKGGLPPESVPQHVLQDAQTSAFVGIEV